MSTRSDDLDGVSPVEAPRGGSTAVADSARPRRRNLPLWQEMLLLLAIALGLAVLIKTFFVQAFYIPSDSMDDTLVENDRILVEKVSYWSGDIRRGDVVVFDDPGTWLAPSDVQHADNPLTRGLEMFGLYPTGGHLVKRVIAVGGDRVRCCDGQGRVLVNGVPLEERSYLARGVEPSEQRFDQEIPADHLWVMGDNRPFSFDSRGHMGSPGGGFVPVESVVGKVFVVVWPLDHAALINRPDTFENTALDQATARSPALPNLLGLAAAPVVLQALRRRLRFRA